MHDISTLEVQWKRYKAKQRKPFYMISLIVITLSTIFLFLKPGNFDWSSLNVSLPSFATDVISKSETETNIQDKTLINIGLRHLEVNGKNVKHQIELNVEEDETLVDIPILDLNGGQQIRVHHSKNQKVKLEIIETSSISAYRDVEQRFLKSHDIDDAFFLAKSYFNKEDYTKSAYWALETNKLDESHEESLLIFAESKVKLGNKSEGISILKRYIRKTNSNPAKDLLYKIQSNHF